MPLEGTWPSLEPAPWMFLPLGCSGGPCLQRSILSLDFEFVQRPLVALVEAKCYDYQHQSMVHFHVLLLPQHSQLVIRPEHDAITRVWALCFRGLFHQVVRLQFSSSSGYTYA